MFITLSLLTGVVYLLVNFADKAIVSKYVPDWRVAVLFSSIAGGVFALAVLPFRHGLISTPYATLIVLSGCILWVAYFLYWKVISDTGAIFVTVVLQLSPVATLILGYLILGEALGIRQLIGFALILCASVGFALKKNVLKREYFLPEAFLISLLASVLFGLAAIIAKQAIAHTDVLTATAWEASGVCLAGLVSTIISRSMRQNFSSTLKNNLGLPLVFIFGVEALYLSSRFLSYAATALGPVAIERVLEGARIFFAFAFGLALAYLIPSIFAQEREEITARKIVLTVVLFIGIYLVS